MIFASVGAQLFTTNPLLSAMRTRRNSYIVVLREVRRDVLLSEPSKEIATHERRTTDEAEAKDDRILVEKLRVLGQAAVNDVRKVRLVADMNKTNDRQELVEGIVALVDPKVL